MSKTFIQKFAVVTASIIFSAGIFTGCSDSFDALNAGSTRESVSRAAFATSGDRIYAVAESVPKDRLQFRLDLGKTLASGTTFTFYTTYNCNNTFPTGTKLTVRDGSGSYTKWTTVMDPYVSGTSDSSRNGWYPVTVTTKNSSRYIGFTYSGEFKKDSVIAIKYISIAPSFDAADWSTFSTDTQIRFEEKKPNEFRVMPEAENIEEPPVINDPEAHVLREPAIKNTSILNSNIDISKSKYKLKFYNSSKWNKIDDLETYQKQLTNTFYEVYPKLVARWGNGSTPKTVTVKPSTDEEDFPMGAVGNTVIIHVDHANGAPLDMGGFAHELTHVVQNHAAETDWFCEGMASYGGFRYFHWQHNDTLKPLNPKFKKIQTWTNYDGYGECVPFFVYMDDKYPTHMEGGNKILGLIDSIDLAAKNKTIENVEDPDDPATALNKLVNKVTGGNYATIEELRDQYLRECADGTWTFNGFKNFKDNFLTENVEGVPNIKQIYVPSIKHAETASKESSFSLKENVFKGAKVLRSSGYADDEKDSYLVDGDKETLWHGEGGYTKDVTYAAHGAQHYVLIDLGKTKEFDSYILRNAGTRMSSKYNAYSWEILTSTDGINFTSWDYQTDVTGSTLCFTPGKTSGRYLLFLVYGSNLEDDNVRLYELMGGLKK